MMGEMSFTNLETNETTTILIDGTIIKEQANLNDMDWCDYCEHWADKTDGRYDGADGLTHLFKCGACLVKR
jgi:hypothetical protein